MLFLHDYFGLEDGGLLLLLERTRRHSQKDIS